VPFVLVAEPRERLPVGQPQPTLRPLQNLNMRFLIYTQHHRVLGRMQLMLTYGEADDNSGPFPIQSERKYQAIKGNGGTVRYVTLPYEAHGYVGLESSEHTLWEMLTWYDRWVKNVPASASAKAK